jgi:hypothetical protein
MGKKKKKKKKFNEMMTRSALYYTNTLSWIFTALAHWNNSLWVDMSLHSDTLSWANQFLLFLFNAECLTEKQQILIL